MAEDYKYVKGSVDEVMERLIANRKLTCDFCYNIHNRKPDTLNLTDLTSKTVRKLIPFGKRSRTKVDKVRSLHASEVLAR